LNIITDNRAGITDLTGNRCGHDPARPRWFTPPQTHKPRPGILRKLIDKARAYYTDPVGTLPSLNLANRFKRSKRLLPRFL
jgi:hypothetical protein